MKNWKKFLTITTVALGVAGLSLPAMAQLNPFAPPDAMDTLNSGGTGPNPGAYPTGNPYQQQPNYNQPQNQQSPYGPTGPEGPVFVDERYGGAQPPPNRARMSPYGPVSAAGSAEGFGAPSGDYLTPGQQGGFGPQGQQSGFAPPAQPVTPKVIVLKGERYFDNFTRDMLEEAMVDEVPEGEVAGQYFDDGTSGDEVPGDNVYTNVTENYEYIGDMTHKLRKRYVSLLLAAESLEPLEFYRLLAVTDDPLSTVYKQIEQEENRDEKRLRVWNMRFLAFTRINPEDERSEFHPLFVPRAPAPPKSPLPQGFDPRPPKQEEETGRTGSSPAAYVEGYWGGEAGGSPVGAASSRYY